jgi:hypothetical protein
MILKTAVMHAQLSSMTAVLLQQHVRSVLASRQIGIDAFNTVIVTNKVHQQLLGLAAHLDEGLDGLLAVWAVGIARHPVVLPAEDPPGQRQRQQQLPNPGLVQQSEPQRI